MITEKPSQDVSSFRPCWLCHHGIDWDRKLFLVDILFLRMAMATKRDALRFAKLKQYRAIATRYDKRASAFFGGVHLAVIAIWLK
jgi:hypothetical protein